MLADDIVVLASSEEVLLQLLTVAEAAYLHWGSPGSFRGQCSCGL